MNRKLIRPPQNTDVTAFMRMLFLKTEQELIHEITRKRKADLVDYAEAASLERVQRILQNMVDESWSYVPKMIETIFYRSDKDSSGYRNARTLTATQTDIVQQLSNNLLGEIIEASETAYKSVEKLFTIGRLENDMFREEALKQVLNQQASGGSWTRAGAKMAREMQNMGVTAFVDKAGRHWSLQSYGNMAIRTTARQAQVSAMLTRDDYDLWQIVKIGSTCPLCAALEGRVYSKSGTNPDYPPLSLAFGKVDPQGPDDLMNTYLNIHPNCLHSFVKYTTIGKTEKQIQKDKDFSNPTINPLTTDPRTKNQIKAYRKKEQARRKLLNDMNQWKRYKLLLGDGIPKTFKTFQAHKAAKDDVYKKWQREYRRQNKEIREALISK
ncbi:MAG TPA: minor capsid protein [Lachnospiraceae bacterium]|nr:minor capsid protein [Lachnospiraceae bacterium]